MMGQTEPNQEHARQQAGAIARDAIHLDPITRTKIAQMDRV
jgi:hypothetical protein